MPMYVDFLKIKPPTSLYTVIDLKQTNKQKLKGKKGVK